MNKSMNILEMIENAEVEWKSLWEVTVWDKKFSGVDKYKQEKVEKYKYFLSSELLNFKSNSGTVKILTTNNTNIFADEKAVNNFMSSREIVCIPWGGNPIVQYYNGNFITGDNRIAYSKDNKYLDNKYLYYYLLNNIDTISSFYRGSGIKHPEMSKVLDFKIPIPSLELQKEIVKRLDKMTNYVTELQAELQAELQKRCISYEYHRDLMLSEEYLKKLVKNSSEVMFKTLGEIGEFTRGNGLLKKDLLDNGLPAIHYGEIYTKYGFSAEKTFSFVNEDIYSKLKKANKNDLLVVTTSENIEDVGKTLVWEGEEVAFSGEMYSFRTHENTRYLGYFFESELFQRQKLMKLSGTKVVRIHSDELEKIVVPIPPLYIQEEVVKVLDKFKELTQDVSGLLPKEIEQRQKQYEYYREKLLTFRVSAINNGGGV